MTSAPDDPRRTAYALGDLDEAERAEFERELEAAPELRAEIEAVRRLAGRLGAALRSEPAPEFGEVVVPAAESPRSRRLRGRRWAAVLTLATSLLLVVGILGGPRLMGRRDLIGLRGSDSRPWRESQATAGAAPPHGAPVSERAPQSGSMPSAGDGQAHDVARSTSAQPDQPIEPARPIRATEELKAAAPNAPNSFGFGVEVQGDRPFESYGKPAAGGLGGGARGKGNAEPRVDDYSRFGMQDDVSYVPAAPGSSWSLEHGDEFRDPNRLSEFRRSRRQLGAESYDALVENSFRRVSDDPLSTFSIDVDTASYSNVRRFLDQRTMPPAGAVRIEELVNYFRYDYPQPEGEAPFAVHLEAAGCPWAPAHRLVRVALKGREIDPQRRPPSNLVFLVDVSGSMRPDNKLPLVKQGLRMLTERLGEDDRVAIVTYAGASGVALPSTGGEQKSTILEAIDALEAGGSTNGASGIELAYALAAGHFLRNGTNRVILCTDGDFNVGVTDRSELTRLIERKAAGGVFLSVLGFGMGNLKDNTLETLADKGNGVYAYIDSEREAHKVLVEELSGTLVTIAKDVKLQVEFNPARVAAYRLLGYENRVLAHQDFNDDRKDAGDIGAGHTATAFYEIVPAGGDESAPGIDPLKYQRPPARPAKEKAVDDAPASNELLTVKLRYKQPDGTTSKLLEAPLVDSDDELSAPSGEFRFAAAVVEFGLLLRHSAHRGGASYAHVLAHAESSLGEDAEGRRQEFLKMVERARSLASGQ